jgi:hypothetical protein
MRQLGVIAVSNANPKLTHGAELPTNHPVAALAAFLWFQAAGIAPVKLATVCEVLKNPGAYRNSVLAVVGRFECSVSLVDTLEYVAQDGCETGRTTRIDVYADREHGPEAPKNRPNLNAREISAKLAEVRKTTVLGTSKEPRYWAIVYGRLVKIPEEGADVFRLSLYVVRANIQILHDDGALHQAN